MFSRDVLRLDAATVVDQLADAIRRDVTVTLRRRGAVIGVSGGVDSALTLALCVRGLGDRGVLAVLMPERESSPDSLRLGRAVAEHFGVDVVVEDLTATLEAIGCYRRRDEAIRRVFPEYGDGWKAKITLPGSLLEDASLNVFLLTAISPRDVTHVERLNVRDYLQIVASSNLKQRTRMAMLYHHAEARNHCVVGTSNKNEYDQGFFVKYGDGGYDLGPIRHLYKTQIYQLAEYVGVPEEVRRAVPSTDTYSAPSSQEEFFFRLPFELMDLIWYGLERGVPADEVGEVLGLTSEQVERVYADLTRKRRTTEVLRAQPLHYSGPSVLGAPDPSAERSHSC